MALVVSDLLQQWFGGVISCEKIVFTARLKEAEKTNGLITGSSAGLISLHCNRSDSIFFHVFIGFILIKMSPTQWKGGGGGDIRTQAAEK